MPRFENKVYKVIASGEHFGHIDFAVEEDMTNIEFTLSMKIKKKNMTRRFTAQAIDNLEMLILTIDELEKMRLEFPEQYTDLFKGSYERL